ncbi:MAG: hypothetical protein WEB60_09350 [Terrimicrobiaceae bacterium]
MGDKTQLRTLFTAFQNAEGSLALARLITLAFLVVRVIAVVRHQHDIDEAQNLHLVYGWLQGELPYRDRFDNHAPLFSLLFVPLAALVGETPHIVLLARLALFPVGLGILWLVFAISKKLANREIAWWTVAISLAFADWSLKSIEFRPDVVWAFFWFFAVWLLVRGLPRLTPLNSFFIGFSLGIALCASIKTTFLVPALGAGCVAAFFFSKQLRNFVDWPGALTHTAIAIAGFALAPGLVFGWIILQGTSWEAIRFCLIDVNRLPFDPIRPAIAAVISPALLFVSWRLFSGPDRESAARGIVFFAMGAYLLALFGFAPELRKQTFLVAYPLLILFLCRFAFSLRVQPALPRIAALGTCAGLFLHLALESKLWRDGLREHRELLTDVLAYTDKGDHLLDGRGETIYADRPVYLTYVAITAQKIKEGKLPATDLNALAKTGTGIAIGPLNGLPEALREFLKQNYLLEEDGRLRAAGKVLKPSWQKDRWIADADVRIPGRYLLLKNGLSTREVTVTIPGTHSFDFGADPSRAILIWKEAWDNGFRPLNGRM